MGLTFLQRCMVPYRREKLYIFTFKDQHRNFVEKPPPNGDNILMYSFDQRTYASYFRMELMQLAQFEQNH